MEAKESMFQIKPPPPTTLNKELLGVWSAWSRMSNREVVREAVAKGLHIDWAHTFLSARKELEPSKTEKWFKDEVFVWVSELLSRKQVFKASHIISNINLEPIEEITRIFLETYDSELRNYLGSHLLKLEKLELIHKEAWNLLQIIEEKHEFLNNFSNGKLNESNVKAIQSQTFDWKCDIGTQLFFKTFDASLKPFVTAEYAWKFLLKHNNLDLIKFWINIHFSKSVNVKSLPLNSHISEQLAQMFFRFNINDQMINLVDNVDLDVPVETQKIILNEFGKFGIFNNAEKNNLIKILYRLADTESIGHLYRLLNEDDSTITLFQFFQLLIDYCVKNEFYLILNWCNVDFRLCNNLVQSYNSRHLDLIYYLKTESNLGHEIGVGQNILKVSQFLCDDLHAYFNSNPLVFLATFMLLYPDIDLMDVFTSNQFHLSIEQFELTDKTIINVIKTLPFLNAILDKLSKHNSESITFYDLLKMHGNLDVDIFNFRIENSSVPNFNTPILVQKYSYKKAISYTFYLKQARPSFASKVYCFNQFCGAQDVNKDVVIRKVHRLIMHKFFEEEIMASCVAFLEMIGQNSYNCRIHITAANILSKSNSLTYEEIQKLLENVSENPQGFLDVLEKVLVTDCSLIIDYTGLDLIEQVKRQEIAMKFSQIHNLKLPELFLEHCAKNNLWLPFLLYIQIYNYPLNQVQKLLQSFPDVTLAEHLFHGLSHDIQIDDQNSLLMRDSRNYYLSRIGVRKNVDTSSSDAPYSSASSYGSYGSTASSSSSSDCLETEYLDFKTDLLQILIRCHNSIDPPKALLQACYVYKCPIFAVLATSYEPDSIITNWLTWLSVSCEIEAEFSNMEGPMLNSNSVTDILKYAVKSGYARIVHESFEVFLPENPLKIFMEFLSHCTNLEFDPSLQTPRLELFEGELKQRKNSGVIPDMDYEMMYLTNKNWIETTALKLLATALQHNLLSQYNQLCFLKFLHDIQLEKYFSMQVPNFLKLFDIVNSLFESKCDIKLDLSVIFDYETIEEELSSCIHELISRKLYDCAFKIARFQGASTDSILINEWYDKFEDSVNSEDFWSECDRTFKSTKVQGAVAVEFFEKCSEKSDDKTEKYHILSLAYKWANSFNLSNLYDVEKKMWLAYFNVETKINDCDFTRLNPSNMLYAEMKQTLLALNGNEDVNTTLSDEQISDLNETIVKLLNIGDIWQALRLTKIFEHKNSDMEVIELCCSLAEGFLMPFQMSAQQRMLLIRSGHVRSFSHRRRRTLMSSKGFSSLSSGSSPVASTIVPMVDQVDAPLQDTLAVLETLVERVKNGFEIVHNILMTYRISVNIEKTYQEVFKCTDPMAMLKEALTEDCSNKLEVVNDFSLLFKWSREKIANFLCEQIIATISDHIKLKLDPIILWNLNLNVDFHLILQLLIENCSTLGLKLYSYASAIHKSQTQSTTDFRISEINLVIELLIRSHDCFTTDCNMEGISIILRKCQTIISLLLTLKSWKLIVRLLTGVARYTEMNYVFHILRENDQFEFLLRKGSRKDNGLKVALLKYLKKYCPEDRELYRMVALHFTLFSEIAQLWEEEARSITRNLIAISKLEMQNNGLNVETQTYVLLTNTDGTKICLNKAMINYTHATEYHLQGEKLSKAMSSAKQAELLALQISMLKGLPSNNTAICILNATDVQIVSLISTELSFAQSLILIEAYNYKVDWASALFEQFVVHNRTNYLDHFLVLFSLTDTLVNDISRKFLALKAISDTTIKNMREIIIKCSSVRLKYRIASELGFSDLVEELLAGNQLAFLKDTVWKKGYKS